jgi:Flp pilus assembly protein TadG
VRRLRRRIVPARAGPLTRRPGHRDSGALTLSYVVVFPVFLIALMTIAQVSVWYLARSAALAAARQGADAARLENAGSGAGPPAAVSFAQSVAHGFLINPRASDTGSTARTIQITVRGRVPTLVPGMHLRVRQVAQAPVEQFTTP